MFIQADGCQMSKLFRLLLSLFFQGVKPEEILPDRYPGKKPPTVAPKLPHRPEQDSSSSMNQEISKQYKAFRRVYPNGYTIKRDKRTWLNDTGVKDE